MKAIQTVKVMAVIAGIIVLIPVLHGTSKGQSSPSPTAGGSVVLAKCNSWVSYMISKDCAYTKIENIGQRKVNGVYDKARVDITIGSTTQSVQIEYGKSITRGTELIGTTMIKIMNIEKGVGGKLCSQRGPGDSDVRVYIPANVSNIQWGNLPTQDSCDVCGVSFIPRAE